MKTTIFRKLIYRTTVGLLAGCLVFGDAIAWGQRGGGGGGRGGGGGGSGGGGGGMSIGGGSRGGGSFGGGSSGGGSRGGSVGRIGGPSSGGGARIGGSPGGGSSGGSVGRIGGPSVGGGARIGGSPGGSVGRIGGPSVGGGLRGGVFSGRPGSGQIGQGGQIGQIGPGRQGGVGRPSLGATFPNRTPSFSQPQGRLGIQQPGQIGGIQGQQRWNQAMQRRDGGAGNLADRGRLGQILSGQTPTIVNRPNLDGRGDGRWDGRGDGRWDGRGDGRWDGRGDGRWAGRGDGRWDGRWVGRIDGRGDGRRIGGFTPNVNIGRTNVRLANQFYRPSYQRHGWYNGYWNNLFGLGVGYRQGGFGGFGGYGVGGANYIGYSPWGYGYGVGGYSPWRYGGWRYPLGWGWGGWGLGSIYYNSGYLPYNNPYYYSSGSTVYDYSQPIQVTVAQSTEQPAPPSERFEDARSRFLEGDYEEALTMVNREIRQSPNDAVLHEFRSLVLFAMRDYEQAAATIHSVLAVGPGWDWTTMISLYPDPQRYTSQFRALERYVTENPNNAAARYLLGYHYITTGALEAAAREFQAVVRLEPSDRNAAELLRLVSASTGDASAVSTQPPEATRNAELPDLNPEQLIGSWEARRSDGSRFELRLTPDRQFVWEFSKGDRKERIAGTFVTEGPTLILQREEGGALIGEVTQEGERQFRFRAAGASPEDRGLEFAK